MSFGLTDHIHFSTTVERVEKVVDAETGCELWEVESTDATGAVTVRHADAVVVSNCRNWNPKWPSPQYPGTFTGTQMHAHDYRSSEAFRGKRVLVVGMGNSATDIAVDASYVGHDVLLSARHGSWIVPKYLFGRPADATGAALTALPWRERQLVAQRMLTLAVGAPQSYGLPEPSHGLFQNHPTISDTILHRITHGEVRLATGSPSRSRASTTWAPAPRRCRFSTACHLDDPSLMFTGLMQSTGAALPVVEAQGKLVAAWVSGAYSLPQPDA